jgi:hypothetical protein
MYVFYFIAFLGLLVIIKCENLLSLVIVVLCRFFKTGQNFGYSSYIG